jgi:quercetin dioxygenase-like cupin family protein
MTSPSLLIRRWDKDLPPQEAEIERLLAEEDLSGYRWSNAPGDNYAAHSHGYHKIIYVVRGSITIGLPDLGEQVELRAGDRLDLPAGVLHSALIGPRGVVCIEAHQA